MQAGSLTIVLPATLLSRCWFICCSAVSLRGLAPFATSPTKPCRSCEAVSRRLPRSSRTISIVNGGRSPEQRYRTAVSASTIAMSCRSRAAGAYADHRNRHARFTSVART